MSFYPAIESQDTSKFGGLSAKCGFLAYFPDVYVPGETPYAEVETIYGEVGFKSMAAIRSAGVDTIKDFLGRIDLRYNELVLGYDQVVGPAIQLIDEFRLRNKARYATMNFGNPNAQPKTSMSQMTVPASQAVRRGKAGGQPNVGRPLRFGFFGHMSPLKGIIVLIDAAKYLNKMDIRGATIEIHGDYSNQPPTFQAAVVEALAEAGQSVVYHGAYHNRDVHRLMQQIDAVVVPSTWWENSPVVIQEAFANGKPVICSNIGGMAEKVMPGVNGLHFTVGQPTSLALVIMDLVENPRRLAEITAIMQRPLTLDTALDAHLSLYRSVLPK